MAGNIAKLAQMIKTKGSEGRFTRWAKSRGYGSVTQAAIEEGKKSKATFEGSNVRHMAQLASTFKKYGRK